MAEISLRAYVKEIDDLIEHEQLDEAIAHARHILQTYPRHLDTYRLLGKAYLEAKRFGDSADIMQRVLSAVPDDFVAHVGMSIVREDEGNLEAAIWHMERAFETNPSNAAVQGELRRLIGRRDGLEPHKVRLTRGALARMYAHGELYPQAIAELRAALQEDPDRPDLQVLLADMYWRTNQRNEAGEVASSITESLPNCREANRILAAVLQAQGRTEEALTYHRRVAALDPYSALVESVRDDPASVDANAVRIEKLVWRPGQPLGRDAGPPDWATGLGAEARAAKAAAAQPAPLRPSWLDSLGAATAAEAAEAAAERERTPEAPAMPAEPEGPAQQSPAPTSGGGEKIPGWMKAAGWNVGTGEAREAPVSFSDDELRSLDAGVLPPEPPPLEEGGLVRAEIPDWLKDVAPPQTAADETAFSAEEPVPAGRVTPASGLDEPLLPPGWAPPAPGAGEEDDDWLKPAIEDSPALPTWMEEQSPGATATIVTWLGDRARREPELQESASAASEPTPQEDVAPVRAELPEWLVDQTPTADEEGMEPAGIGSAPPAWLSGVAEAARGSMVPPAEVPATVEDEGEPSEIQTNDQAEAPPEPARLPDWLQTIAGAESASRIRPRPGTLPERIVPEPAPPKGPATPPTPSGESFGWLRELAEAEPPTPSSATSEPVETEAPAWLAGERAADSSRSALGRSAGPEWLRGIAEPEPAPAAEESPPMDWLRGIAEPTAEESVQPAEQARPAEAAVPRGQDEAVEWLNLVGPGEQARSDYSTGEFLRLIKEDGVPARDTQPPVSVPSQPVVSEAAQVDDDQVFDWLEALAAKQSVPAPEKILSAETSLPTRPTAVPMTPQPAPPAPEEIPAEPESALDWLEELADDQEEEPATFDQVTFEAASAASPMFEATAEPELAFEDTVAGPPPTPEVPEWLKQLVAETPAPGPELMEPAEEPEPASAVEEAWPALPAWMLAAQPTEEEPTVPPLSAALLPMGLRAAEPIDELAESWVPPWEQVPADETGEAPAEIPAAEEMIVRRPPSEPIVESGDQPSGEWAEFEQVVAVPPTYREPADAMEEVPDWLRTPAPYRLSEAEAAPAEAESTAEAEVEGELEIPDWLAAPAAEPAVPAMTAPPLVTAPPPAAPVESSVPAEPVRAEPVHETPLQAVSTAPSVPAEPRHAEAVPPPLPPAAPAPKPPLRAPKPTAAKAPMEDKLQEARHALAVGDYRRAAHGYAAVIKKKYQLTEVTSELELALDRNPKASDLWQALGDAYMKGDRLQEAIDAYERGVAVA